jgi:hypothetical protein
MIAIVTGDETAVQTYLGELVRSSKEVVGSDPEISGRQSAGRDSLLERVRRHADRDLRPRVTALMHATDESVSVADYLTAIKHLRLVPARVTEVFLAVWERRSSGL